MRKWLAALAARRWDGVRAVGGAALLVLAFTGSESALAAPVDVQRGLAWLQAQVQPQGQLAVESQAAAPQQARCETAATLIKLSGSNAQVAALVASLQEPLADAATESVACWQQLRQQLGETILASDVEARHLKQQGYAPYEGYGAASALDTGWALAAQLQNLADTGKATLLAWLQANQKADGSFATNGVSDVLSTAVILRSLKAEASNNATAAQVAANAAAWLLGKASEAAWANDAAAMALIFEAVHPYTGQTPALAPAVEAYLLSQQQADGSWAADPYVTAIVLRALALVPVAPLAPTQAALKVKFTDARTGAPVPGVALQGSGGGAIAATSDAAGMIQVRGLAAGTYQLQASAAGYASVNFSLTLSGGQSLDLGAVQLIVPASASTAVVSGVVRDQDSQQPIAGATVEVQGQAGSAITAADGSYLISNLNPAYVTVSAGMPGYASATAQATLQAGQVLNFSPLLVRGGTIGDCRIHGQILNGVTLQPLVAVGVVLSGANNQTTLTDATGRFNLAVLSSGSTTITAAKGGYDTVRATTQLACSATSASITEFSPRMFPAGQTPSQANTAGMTGVVMDARTGAPIANAQLTVTPDIGVPVSAQTQVDGRFSIAGLDGPSARLQVQAVGYEGLTMQYVLAPLQTLDLGQVRLRPPQVQQLLPDLKMLRVRRHTAQTDAQTLHLGGAVEAQLTNAGSQTAPADVQLIAFSDANRNNQFDPSIDLVLGQGALTQSLAPGQTATLYIGVSGLLQFRDAPIHVAVDPGNVLAELLEINNVDSTASSVVAAAPVEGSQHVLKWHWTGSTVAAAYKEVMNVPLVAPLYDTNGDGKINTLDEPQVIFPTYWTYYYTGSYLRILDGKTGREIRTPDVLIEALVTPAIADIDGDGKPEIIAIRQGGNLVAINPDGSIKWQSADTLNRPTNPWGGITVADFDGDGKAEIFYSNQVFNFDGTLRWTAPSGRGRIGGVYLGFNQISIPVVEAVKAGERPLLLLGGAAFNHLGQQVWEAVEANGSAIGDGFVAVSDLDGDGSAEIVLISRRRLFILSDTGTVKIGPIGLPGGDFGGPPTIADFDGDGLPDIGVALARVYCAYRGDGTNLWCKPTLDTGGYTGSTVFDFSAGGKAEVLYADESQFWIFDGQSGQALKVLANPSQTASEYPVVADIDGDGRSDLLVGANYSGYSLKVPSGVRAFSGVDPGWVGSRSIWNQHAYSISNVNDDLSLPRNPVPSWQTHNTYRLNKRLDGDPGAVPDLTVGYVRVADGGALGSTFTVRAGNAGSYKVPVGTKLAAYSTDPALGQPTASALIGTATLSSDLLTGQWVDVNIATSRNLAGLNALGRAWIVGDDDGTGKRAIVDFDRTNNTISADLSAIAVNLAVSVATDKPSYSEAEQAVFTATVTNAGSFARQAQVRLSVASASGQLVEVLPLPATLAVPVASSASSTGLWSAGGVLAGDYQVKAELITPEGVVYGSATASFVVTASQAQADSARILTDRASYSAAQSVQLTSRAANLTANVVQEDLSAVTVVRNAAGQEVFSRAEPIAQLAPAGQRQYSYALAASGLAAGSYSASLQLLNAQGTVLAQSATIFTVLGVDQSGVGVAGQLQAMPSVVLIGQSVALNLTATNNGNAGLTNIPVTVRIVEPTGGVVLASFSATVASWAQGASQSFAWSWSAQGLDGQTVVAAASASLAGREVNLGQANIRVVAVPQVNAEPAQLSFGAIYPGENATQTLTLSSIGSAPATSLTFSLTGASASQYVIPQGGCTGAPSLPIGSTCTLTISYRPQAAGSHSGELSVGYANAEALLVPLAGQAKPVIFTGSVAADAAEVEAGQSVGLSYSVSNPASVASPMAGALSVRESAGQILSSWPLDLNVPGLASYAGNQPYASREQAQTLTVALTQQLGTTSVVLATTTFTVADPPVPLGVAAQLKGQARILVLVSCPPGLGQAQDAACVTQRSQAITAYLSGLGLRAKTVSTGEAFAAEMRCGTYNTYWLSGGAIKLDEQTVGELREAVYRGEALWMDGVHDARNQLLHDSAGVKEIGKLPTSNHAASLAEAGLYGSQNLATLGQPTRFEPTTGAVEGLFTHVPGQQAPIPAVVRNDWGQGKSLLFAFDLAAMITADVVQASGQLAAFVSASASHAASGSPTLTLGDVTQLAASIGNLGPRTVAFRAEATLPAALASLATSPPAQLAANNDGSTQAIWSFSLPGGASQELAWLVRAGQAGSYSVPLAIYSLPSAGSSLPPKLRASTNFEVQVKDAPGLLQQALSATQALQPTLSSDKSNQTKALTAATQALALHNQGSYEQAILKWTAAADALIGITSADSRAARLAVSLALEASTDSLCVQRCNAATCQ